VIAGGTLSDALETARFDAVQLRDSFRRAVMKRIDNGAVSTKAGSQWIEFYENQAESYTYLTMLSQEEK
jgi:arginine decarboxylase-like protein